MKKRLKLNNGGYLFVEAAILFPIIFMIFAGLVLLSMYLPQRAILQQATQRAATALAVERGDTWLNVDDSGEFSWVTDKKDLPNVYVAFINAFKSGDGTKAESITRKIEGTSAMHAMKSSGYDYTSAGRTLEDGGLTVTYGMVNYVVYLEIVVTATRSVKTPVNLSFIGFPDKIDMTVSSTAVVQNGDEFIRNMDIAVDIVNYFREKFPAFDNIFNSIEKIKGPLGALFGI
ncbi:MAG: pilus assembly protein [Oscillospiraceae bacterium]|jgi:hypothetical protein|nr:pilus assembly protein [Oscillospiraceae bacterium]